MRKALARVQESPYAPLLAAVPLLAILGRRSGRRRSRSLRTEVSSSLLRSLGLVYFIAFTSLRVQQQGLYGGRGIAPVRLRGHPQLCVAGQVCGAALTAGLAPKVAAWAAWATHVSLVKVGSPFLDFQWDALLNEAGLLGALAAPNRWRLTRRWSMGRLPRWLFRFLALRLHFESGLAKLQSRDAAWRRGVACALHYDTQPLPTPLAYHARRLPLRLHRLATASVLVLETLVPWLILGPKRLRRLAFILLEGLQAAIALTGNFAYFNLLTAAVTLSLLEPTDARPPARRRVGSRRRVRLCALGRVGTAAETVLAALMGMVAVADLADRVLPGRLRWKPIRWLRARAVNLRTVSSYGLFAHMTRTRPEIVIEGSVDGRHWEAYELPYKPGDPSRPPRWVAPHQPRLDWQLWFAALSPFPPLWFRDLLWRLLEGSPAVLELFARNPFPGRPPRYVRALLYNYRMSDNATRRRTGQWWQRELLGLYFPPCRLADPSDARATEVQPWLS
jgi:hypothetical protein